MLSRNADAIYWMSRSIERAENVARFLDVNIHLTLDLADASAEQWVLLVAVTVDEELFLKQCGEPTRDAAIRFLAFDRGYPNSIVSCLGQARENARSIREVISREMWEQLNEAFHFVSTAADDPEVLEDPGDFLVEVKRSSSRFVGLTDVTMTHNEAWHFARLGRLVERADKTSRIVDVKYFILLPDASDVGTTLDEVQWAALLKSASALEMYRQRFGRISPSKVIEFLLLDREFPRAIRHCLIKADQSLHAITGTPLASYSNLAERRVGMLAAELEFADIKEVIREGLHEYLDNFQTKLNAVGDAVFESFFALQPSEDETAG
jgi:uncharacterized alpha-E superfamily protein